MPVTQPEAILGPLFNAQALEASVEAIRGHCSEEMRVGLVLGSGWTGVKEQVRRPITLPLESIPHFPRPKVSGHGAELILGQIAGLNVVLLSGRKHLYEGEGLANVVYPIEVFRRLGVRVIGLFNAAGAARRRLSIGDLMVIRDHLDSTWHRYTAPLARLAEDAPNFEAGRSVYDEEFAERLLEIGERERLPLHSGVYAFTLGPFYESPSEVRCLGRWGCDAIGMSTVPEAVYARLRGMRIFALSGITNMGTGLAAERHSHESVKQQAAALAPRATRLLNRFLDSLS